MFWKTPSFTFALLLNVAAGAALPSIAVADTVFSTDTHAAPVAFQALRIEAQHINGQIRRTQHAAVPNGHVDYTIIGADGTPQTTGWVEHSAGIRSVHSHRPSLFSIPLSQPLNPQATVQLTYHIGTHS